ncbi:DUF2207 domain-containing protein, partial [Candidatus Woesebacteria bacterium]|nr:DUF2207 domain-containing protein [Candidatus Woesebacteria bacterium]
MQKNNTILKKVILVGLLFAASSLSHPISIWAKSYTIDPVVIEANLQRDGSMSVTEQRTFNFDGDFTFAYEEILKNPDQNTNPGRTEPYIITDFSICDELECYKPLLGQEKESADEIRPSQRFFLNETDSSYYLKWFYRSNTQKTFTLTYIVRNAVTLHSDTAEIYWQWVGNKWEIPQNSVRATLNFSTAIPEGDIKAWLHGPLSGIVAIPDSKTVSFSVDRVPALTFVEGRVVVPLSAFDAGAKGSLSKQQIVDQEAQFIQQTEATKHTSLVVFIGLALLIMFVGFLGIVLIVWLIVTFIKYGKDEPLPNINQAGTLWEPPSDIDPAQVEQLLSGKETTTPKAFTATVLSLVQNKIYRLVRGDEKEGIIFKNYRYYLIPTDRNDVELSSIQQYVWAFLHSIPLKSVNLEGKMREVLPLNDISKWCLSHRMESHLFFTQFKTVVLEENLRENFFDESSKKHRWKYTLGIVSGIGLFMFAVVTLGMLSTASSAGKYTHLMNVAAVTAFFEGPLAVMLFILGNIFYSSGLKRTQRGGVEAAGWKAFKKHLKDYAKTKESPIDSIILWEKYLVYGTILGVSVKALSQLPVNFSAADQRTLTASWGGTDMLTAGGLSHLSSAIGSISTAATASYGASGVGSSGGSSGGGGGG